MPHTACSRFVNGSLDLAAQFREAECRVDLLVHATSPVQYVVDHDDLIGFPRSLIVRGDSFAAIRWIEWDAFPDPPKRRKVRVAEILPPQQPRYVRVTLHHRHHAGSRSLQHWVIIAAAIFVALLLLRSPLVLLMLVALAWKHLAEVAAIVAILAIAAYRAHRAGRPF